MEKQSSKWKKPKNQNNKHRSIYIAIGMMLLVNFLFSQSNTKGIVIEYRTITKGSYQLLKLKNDMIVFTRKSGDKTIDTLRMDGKKWKRITDLIQTLKLKELPYLEAPAEKQKHDGAVHAKLKIIFMGKVYESSSFDHGDPPVAIRVLVGFITNIRAFD
ncbi:hypothetical protein ACA086_08410 [Muriicola sp. E247]|uniref:hypothetical protein n=1 Tax=Muriicola sp. E247 TaxID=3242730 RepID=UPI003523F87D